MSLSTQSKRLFERSLPPGTILVSAPGQRLEMRVTPPFDFLHFHVANRLLRDEGLAADQDDFVPYELSPFRDTLAEALGRSLLEENVHRSQPEYARGSLPRRSSCAQSDASKPSAVVGRCQNGG